MIQKIEYALLTFISMLAFFAFFGVLFIDFRLFGIMLIAIYLLSSIGLLLGFWMAVKTAEPLVLRIALTQGLLGAFLLEVSIGIAYVLGAFNDVGIQWLIKVAIIGSWTTFLLSILLVHMRKSIHFLPISVGMLITFASLLVCFAAIQGHIFVLFLLLFVWLIQFITEVNRFAQVNSIRYRWVTGLLIAWVGIATIICIFSADEFARRN